jgi:hypothetical protein
MGFKHALTSAYKRAFRTKSRKLVAAGIALVGAVLGVSIAFASDPGVNARVDYGMNLNGSNVTAYNSGQIIPASGDFTVEAYFKDDPANAMQDQYLISQGAPGSSSNFFSIFLTSTAPRRLAISWGNTNTVAYVDTSINPGDWTHMAVMYSDSAQTLTIYINGYAIYSRSSSSYSFNNISAPTPAAGFWIGRNALSNNGYFLGSIDQVLVFNSVRASSNFPQTDPYTYLPSNTANLLAEYDFNEGKTGNGTIYDRTANNYDLTLSGSPTFTDMASYSFTSRASNVIKFNRTYLTAGGGWYPPAAVVGATLTTSIAAGGGGGGGGEWTPSSAAYTGGGGGGGGAGVIQQPSITLAGADTPVVAKVGLGGPGGSFGDASGATYNGTTGYNGGNSVFSGTNANGGMPGKGGGLGNGTTYTSATWGKGGAGGNNGNNSGGYVTATNDGGGGASAFNVASSRVGATGYTTFNYNTGVPMVYGGSGGYGGGTPASSVVGANASPNSGSGGNGGGGGKDGTAARGNSGGTGGNGLITLNISSVISTDTTDYYPTFAAGQYAQAVSSSTDFDLAGDFTIEVWAKPSTNCSAAYCVLLSRENNYALGGFNGTYRWQVTRSDGTSSWYDTGVPMQVGGWQHIALVRSASSILFYINGQLMVTQNNGAVDASGNTIALNATSTVGSGVFTVGAVGLDVQLPFVGALDDLRIWNVARTATQIGDPTTGDFNRYLTTAELSNSTLVGLWDMNEGASTKVFFNRKSTANVSSDLGVFGSPTMTNVATATTITNSDLALNAANSQTAYAADNSVFELTGSNFTISAWWKINACGDNILVSKENTYAVVTDSSCKINVQMDAGADADAVAWTTINTDYVMSTATWHYVSVIKVGTTLYLYVDGALASTKAGAVSNLGNRSTYFGVGSRGTSSTRSGFTSENIDDVRLWSADRRTNQGLDMGGFVPHDSSGLAVMLDFNSTSTSNQVPNMAANASAGSQVQLAGTTLSGITESVSPPPSQPVRKLQYITKTFLHSTVVGSIPAGASSADYWIVGGGGGGGSGASTSLLSGAGGGAGGIVEGSATGLTAATASQTVGVGGRYAANSGDDVLSSDVAKNGTSSKFAAYTSADGGGAGGSGSTTSSQLIPGANGASGGGGAQGSSSSGGTATQGFAGGSGTASASGGGGGSRSIGLNAGSSSSGGGGGAGVLLPISAAGQAIWAGAGGAGFGAAGATNSNSNWGATSVASDATVGSGSGGGGNGFASASATPARGGFGANGFILASYFANQPYLDQYQSTVLSGSLWTSPLSVSLRDLAGNVVTATDLVSVTTPTTGCTVANGAATAAVAGLVSFKNLTVTSTSGTSCVLSVTDTVTGGVVKLTVSVLFTPASLTISTGTTTAGCSFTTDGYFNCPLNTNAAILNNTALNTALGTYNLVTVATSGGSAGITVSAPVSGASGSLYMSSKASVSLGASIQLAGANKDLIIRAGTTFSGTDATLASPLNFSTNGGNISISSGWASYGQAKLSAYNFWNTNGGSFTLGGGADPTVGYAYGDTVGTSYDGSSGIFLGTGARINAGTGSVTLRGKFSGNNGNSAGIYFSGSNSIDTTDGAISITGIGSSQNSVNYRQGISLNTTSITSVGGPITIVGDSSADNGASSLYDSGAKIVGSTIKSTSGAITVTGTCRDNSNKYLGSGGLTFYSSQSAISSTTGNINLNSPSNVSFDFINLALSGGGTHTVTAYSVSNTNDSSFQARGTGDFILTSPAGSSGFYGALNIPATWDLGTTYKNISILDVPTTLTNSKSFNLSANLVATQSVTLRGLTISGTAGVTAPTLAMQSFSTSSNYCKLSGTSNVTTLALNATFADSTSAGTLGIVDADGWMPGNFGPVTAKYGVPVKLVFSTQPATTDPKNAPLTTQPIVQMQDAYSLGLPSGDQADIGYVVTPAIGTGTAGSLSPLTSVTTSGGLARFSGLKVSAAVSTTITVSSPGLTSATSAAFTPTAYGTASQAVVTAGSSTATSGVNFSVQPTLAQQDAYGNNIGTYTSSPTVALTSYPTGASASSLTNTAMPAATSGVSTGTNFKITGPSGTYVITFTLGSYTTTLTVQVTGVYLTYGAASLNMSPTTYPVTISKNGIGTVTYSSSSPAICSVASNGDMTTLAIGTCNISATQASDGQGGVGGTGTTSVTIAKGNQATVTISASPSTVVYLGTTTLTGGGGTVGSFTYYVASGNCTVGLTSGVLTAGATTSVGTPCVVYAQRAGDANWNNTNSAQLSVSITQAAQTTAVTIPSTGKNIGYSNTLDLSTLSPYGGGNGSGAFIFSTTTPNCSITGTTLTSFVAVGGTCSVSVRRDQSTNYQVSPPTTMTITVVKGTQTISYNSVSSSYHVLDTLNLGATASSALPVTYSLGSGSSAYCSLNGSTVTFNAVGTCVVKADQAGNANVSAATQQSYSFTIARIPQTITFAAISDDVVRTTTLSLGATSSSSLAVTYAVASGTTNSACTVTSTGVVTLSAVGVCSITVSQAGNSNYEAATDVTQTFNVAKGTQSALTITSASNPQYGQTVALTATGGNGSASYSFAVVSGPCSIAGGTTSLILGDAGTTCVISVDRAGDANWNAATTATQTITTAKAPQATLNITNRNAITYGDQVAVTYAGGSGNGAITWSVTSPCSISGTTLSVGNAGVGCTLSLSKDGDDNYLPTTATLAISVVRASQAAVTITSTDHYAYRQSLTLAATGGSGSGAITFAATGSCTINAGNLLSGGSAGAPCSVIATRAQSTNYNAESSVAMTITIDKADQTISPITVLGTPRALGTVNLIANSDSNLNVDLSIDNGSNAVCTISGRIVSFLKAGDCVVNADQAGDTNFNAATQVQTTLTAAHASQSINLVNPGFKRYLDASFNMTGSTNSQLGITYSLGAATTGYGQGSEVCAVSQQGYVQIGEVGTCQIVADQAGDDVYDPAAQVSVTFTIGKALQTALTLSSADTYVYGTSLQLSANGGDGNGAVTFVGGPSQQCSIDPATNILSGGDAGSGCNVRILKAADDHFEAAQSGLIPITITQAPQTVTITSTPVNPTALGTYTLTASSESGDTITYSIPSTTTVCSVSGNVVTFLTQGGCLVQADQLGNTNYQAGQPDSQNIHVAYATQTLSWTTPTGVTFGDQPFQLQASASSGLGLIYQYTPGGACSVSSLGEVTLTAAGTCDIYIGQPGNATYGDTGQQQISFNVAKSQQQTLSIGSVTSADYGQDIYLNTQGGSGGGQVTYETRGTCTENNAVLTTADVGSLCEVRATQAGDANYEPITSSWVSITVNKVHQTPIMMTSSGLVTYGNTINLSYVGGSGPNSATYVTTGTCSESGGVLTVGDAGSACTVKAVVSASTNYFAEESQAQIITIFKANQSISFTSSPSNAVALGSYQVTASADSGDAVTFSIAPISSSVCSVSGSTVTFLTGGPCVVNADQAGGTNFNQAQTTQQTISVGQASQTITFASAGLKHFGDANFSASATSTSGLTILYGLGSNTTNSACTVASDGTVTITNVGICEVTADQMGNSTYAAAATARQSITIAKGTQQALAISSANYVIYAQTQNLTTSGGSGQGSVSFEVSGDCTESSGVLTVGVVGSSCQVRATKAADSQYDATTSPWLTVSVIKAHQATLTISSASSVAYGSTLALAVSGGSGPSSVTYTTTGTCSVANGILSVGVVGSSCSVIATNAESANYLVASSQPQTVTVVKAANVIHLNPLATPAVALATYQVDASADSGDPVAVTVDASTSRVCSASAGVVTFVTSGSCVINLNEDGNSNFNSANQLQETVNVGLATQTITVQAAGVKHYGDSTFQASASASSNLPITYSLGSGTTNNACSVASDGTVTILDVGSCDVSADQPGNNVYGAAATAGQIISILKGTQATLTMSSASSVAYGTTLNLTTSGGSGQGVVTFATIGHCTQSNGVLSVGTVGSSCRVSASKAGDSRYNSTSSALQTVTITRGPQATLTISSASNVAYDSSITLTTSGGSGNGAVTYMSGGTCYVSFGVLYPGAAGVPCVVRAHKAGDSNYDSIDSADFTVTVDKADQSITLLGSAVNPVAHDFYTPFVNASSNLNVDVSVDPSSSSVCSYGHGGIYFDTAGDCVINYDQPGDSNYNAAPQLQETITVAKLTQTISTTQIGLKHYGDSAFQIISSSDSGLPLTFTLDPNTTSGACTVSSTGYVTILAPGTCAWIASQAGDASYLPTTTNVLWFSIDRAQQAATTLVLSSTSAPAGGTITMSVTGGTGNGSVRYVVGGTCTVSGNTLTVGNAGSQCTVYGIKEYDDYYAAEATFQQTITVTRATQATLTIDSTDTVVYGNTITLSTTGGSGGGSVSYTTTGTCSVSNGILTVGNAGSSCTVTATKAQSANFNAANSAAQTITITRASQTISITSSPSSTTALDTYVVHAAATSGLSVDVTIDNSTSSACSVSGSTVTFLTSGSCVINANQSGGTNYTAASQVQQTITVAKKAQSSYLTIPSVSGNRQLGDADFSVSGSADSGLAVTYGIGSSTTNNSCSINSSTGLVSILDVGECYITVNQGGNATWAVASAATGHFTIGLGAQAALTISSSSTVAYGQVINLQVTGGTINSAVSYTTTGTCTVNYHTLFVTDAGSACTVTAHKNGNSQYLPVDSAAQTITVIRATQAFFYLSNNTAYVSGETYTLQTTGGSGDGAVSYSISGDCTLNGAVLSLGNAGAQCLVTATKGQSLNYDAISDQTRIISIGKANQSISITSTPSNPTALDTYTFAATADSGAPVTATIDNASSTVCSIANNVVTYLTAGSCVINADQAGTSNYNAAGQVQQTIVVAKKAQTISWPAISGKQFGVANFSAGASAGSSLSIAYTLGSSTTNSACSITSSGTVSILAAGECYLVADQAGDDTWAAAPQVTIHFNVLRGNQATLSMASASSVDFGNSISLSTTGGSGAGSVSYSTTGTCSVSGTTLTVGNAGSACTVTATKALDAQYLAQTTTAQTITINRAAQATLTVSSIAGLKHGQTMTLTASGGSGNGAITYTASGACTVSGSTLTGGNAGANCVVYATKAQSTNYLVVDSVTVTEQVGKSAQTITVTSTPVNATALQTYTVSATASSSLPVSVAIASSTSTKCSVVGNVVTFNEVDSCVIEVSQAGDSNFDPATTVTQTISVARATDIITIPTLADRTVFSSSLTVNATSLSNAQLTYTSVPQTGNVFNCSITSSGTLTLITPGRCEIAVSHADGSVYAAATSSASFMITRADQAALNITSASSVDYLASIALTASGGSGTGAISYTANGTCAITNGVLTVGDVGSSCSVTATRAGDTNYNAVTSATQTITVNQINQDAIIVVSAAHVRYGQQLPLVSAGGSGSGAETWSVDTTSVANSAGCAINGGTLNLSATSSGACDVVVTKAASRNYRSAVSPRFSVTVDKAYQSVTFTSSVPTAPVSGDTYTVAATASSGLAVSYSVTSASAAYCSITGAVVSFTGTGDCEIVASQAGDGRYLAAPDASQTIAVGSLNQVITASNVRNHTYGDPAFVVVGETTSTSPVTFSLGSNTTANSCSVTSTGVVTILAVGHCELVLSAAADAQYAAASDITKSFEIVADQASAPFITSVSADNQSVTLSFLAPSYIGGSAIRAYGINAYLNGVLAASYSGCAANQTSCTMTGLTNGLAYTFRMVAVNAAGDGAESSATGAVTPATHAEAVRQLVAVGVNTALDVSWAAPASLGGGTFDSYRIYVRPRGGTYPSTPTEVIYSYSTTSKQLTGLVNGTSYDVKVVTITTANTVQLVSNTAEVLQYPKTTPDAPQSVSLAPVGTTGLLVSWTAPISDGGDAIATYAAQVIGGTNCSVSATTNACEVSGLVDGATYTVAVVATNGAGNSPATEAQIVFHAATVASANQGNQSSSGGGSGGGSGASNPIIVNGGTAGDQVHGDVWISLDKIATANANGMGDGVNVSGAVGGKLIFKGKGLGLIYSAYIGNHIPVKILSATNEQVVVQVPASKLGGWQDMWFFTDSHSIRYMDVIQYVVAKAPVVKVLGGFKPNAMSLTKYQKAHLWKIAKLVGNFSKVDCKGSPSAALATCKAIKARRTWVKIHITKVKISRATVSSKRVAMTFTK